MKLSRFLLAVTLGATLALTGCGDDGGGNGGGGNPDDICADCAPGRALEDCTNDVLACTNLIDPGPDLDECLSDAAC